MILCNGAVDLRLGSYLDVIDARSCDAVICDPPYGARTHDGHDNGADQVRSATGQLTRTQLDYQPWSREDAADLIGRFAWQCRGWMAIMTSHDLIPQIEAVYRESGRYAFAPVPIIQKRPRLVGDGPSSWAVYMMVSRPKTIEFSRWGCLPGAYEAPTVKDAGIAGAKPLGLMQAIIRDYTRPGDLVVDPFCGSGTTALACAMENRRCITSEISETTFNIARKRLERGVQRSMFA